MAHSTLARPSISTMHAAGYTATDLTYQLPVPKPTWMADHWHHIGQRRLSEVLLPGTYASASYSLLPRCGVVAGWPWVKIAYHLGWGQVAVKWLRTQEGDLYSQLHHGYRYLDLHITNCREAYCWCHGLVGTSIGPGLLQVRDFLQEHPGEIIMLGVQYVPRDSHDHCSDSDTVPNEQQLIDELIKVLEPDLVPSSLLPNPRMDTILRSGGRIILSCSDMTGCSVSETAAKWMWYSTPSELPLTFSETITGSFALFELASSSMYSKRHTRDVGRLMLVLDPSLDVIGCDILLSLPACASLLLVTACLIVSANYAWFRFRSSRLRRRKRSWWSRLQFALIFLVTGLLLLHEAYNIVAPCFQGHLPHSLLQLANTSNLYGEVELNPDGYKYSSEFVHNRGINDMMKYWISRPASYHPNIILINSFKSSALSNIAVQAMTGSVSRSIRLVFVGTPLEGKQGIRTMFACHPMQLSYLLASRDEGHVITWMGVIPGEQVTLREGQHPMDTHLIIFAGNSQGDWYQLYSGNLQALVDRGHDLYIRGYETRNGRGLAYVTRTIEDATDRCMPAVPPAILNYTKWDAATLPQCRRRRALTSSAPRKPRWHHHVWGTVFDIPFGNRSAITRQQT